MPDAFNGPIVQDFKTAVQEGLVPGWQVFRSGGERVGMGTTVNGEDIWQGNDLTPAPTSHTSIPIPNSAGEAMSLTCENAADTAAGTGAQSVTVGYLDAAGDEQKITVATNGVTPVSLGVSPRFIQYMHSQTIGSNGVAVGHIKVHNTADAGLVYCMIAAGGNKSLVSNKMVPAGKRLLLQAWNATEAKNKRVAVRIRATSDEDGVRIDSVFCFKDVTYLNQTASPNMPLVDVIPAFSIVKVSGWPDVSGADASCSFWGYLVDV